MQEIILDRYLMCFVFEGILDTQYLQENSSVWLTASQLIINQRSVSYSLRSEGLRHLHIWKEKMHNRLDWGREDHPGTKSRKRTCAKRWWRKIEWLQKEREERREKNSKQFRYKSLIQRKMGKKVEGKSKWQKRWNESKDKGTEMCEKTMGGLFKQH